MINDEDHDTDDKGQYIKPERLQDVLAQFPNGTAAEQVYTEIDDKVYLIGSLNQQPSSIVSE